MVKKIHQSTAAFALEHARKKLGDENVELRPTTAKEQMQVRAKHRDNEMVIDTVVARDSKGNEYLLGITDDLTTRHLNAESAVATAIGAIPVVGPPVAATLALIDIGRAAIPMAMAKKAGEATHPADRALLRMGLKHLGLATASMSTGGLAHEIALGAEVVTAVIDGHHSKPEFKTVHKSLATAMRGIFTVKFQDHSKAGSLRVVMMKQITFVPEIMREATAETGDKGAGNPEETNGPPAAS